MPEMDDVLDVICGLLFAIPVILLMLCGVLIVSLPLTILLKALWLGLQATLSSLPNLLVVS